MSPNTDNDEIGYSVSKTSQQYATNNKSQNDDDDNVYVIEEENYYDDGNDDDVDSHDSVGVMNNSSNTKYTPLNKLESTALKYFVENSLPISSFDEYSKMFCFTMLNWKKRVLPHIFG